ncbi:hypothetical protein BGZ73_002896 [Actinomortierella ambigua]|nr:hypothetical protein BGZ73_002896 [Actinomortierella ambigua]
MRIDIGTEPTLDKTDYICVNDLILSRPDDSLEDIKLYKARDRHLQDEAESSMAMAVGRFKS